MGALTGAAAHGVAYERHQIDLVTRDVAVRGLPPALDGLRIGMITDVHHSSVVPADDVDARGVAPQGIRSRHRRARRRLRLVFRSPYAAPVADLLMPLAHAPHGSFAVLGNHDDEREVPAALAARGFTC